MRLSFLILAAAACALSGCVSHHGDDDFVTSVQKLRPAVVLLSMQVPGDTKNSGPDDEFATGTVVASGVWGSDILTVQHAIEGAWNLRVTIANKQKVPGKVIAADKDLDIALVRTARKNLPVVALGKTADAQPGRMIGLLGYPIPDQFDDEGLGLATSVNSGRVSSMRQGAIEVTLPIVPGESGGPIFLSDNGEIVGMAESRFDEERSIGFALPIDDAKKFLHKYDASHGF
ncbi:MAG TPA: serine protease [Candidatus Baltobacteraceae bacterium]|jgi:S1-C subfamily serine protease|nr:serine protease [Candidatus Baltobacteraceae bacterium]